MLEPAVPSNPRGPLARLSALCRARRAGASAERLADLEAWLAADLEGLDRELEGLAYERSIAGASARHQLAFRGKLLRPLCVLLAARVGDGGGAAARPLAVAVELIHNATLLHDDVIDLGETRRGVAAARAIYGNAASVLAGDWLLIQAIRRIRGCRHPGLLEGALDTIDQMIAAEALELENRRRVDLERGDYFRVVDGKTAALFRFALAGGASVGGLEPGERQALATFGDRLGVAFQLVDDALDLDGDPAVMGKAALSDLREGKTTYPLLLAMERDQTLRRRFADLLREDAAVAPVEVCQRLRRRLQSTGAVAECRALARRQAEEAVAALRSVRDGRGRRALTLLAMSAVEREQ